MRFALALLLALAFSAEASMAFDLQGHRGARELRPENTIAAFEKALEIGVTTVETDLALTKDGHLVLSHNPSLNPELTRDASGQWIGSETPISTLTLADLAQFDVGRIKPGTKYATQFATQVPVDGARIPRFAELVALGERTRPGVRYNIETKLSPDKPDETADPEKFARAVVDAVRTLGVAPRVSVQSFDWRTLLAVKRMAPEIATVCLTIDTPANSTVRPRDGKPSPWLAGLDPQSHAGSIDKTALAAGCSSWSPFWRNIAASDVAAAQALGLKVIPWTVNDPADMANLIDMKIDGLITDYPDRARIVLDAKGIKVAQ